MQSGWSVHRIAGRCGAGPAIALADEHALAHEVPDDFLDEQRIAPGSLCDEMLDLGESAAVHPAEQTAHEPPSLVRGEGSEADDGVLVKTPRQPRPRNKGIRFSFLVNFSCVSRYLLELMLRWKQHQNRFCTAKVELECGAVAVG